MTTTLAIVFDYGGVIEGPLNEGHFADDLAALAHQHGFEAGRALWGHLYASDSWEKAKRGQITRDEFWQERLGALGLLTDAERSLFLRTLYRSRGIRPEMGALLRELHGRIRLAILSNTSRRDLARYLADERGLGGLFEVVVSSAAVGLAKPEPAIFRLTLNRLGLLPHAVLFVDDLARNTRAAEALCIPAVVFTTASALREVLSSRGILD